MGLKNAPYYWLECDGCGERCDYGDFTAWADPSFAIDPALEDYDWTTDGGEKYHCPTCPSLTKCERCGQPAGDLPGERDDHCETCWAELEAEDAAAGAL